MCLVQILQMFNAQNHEINISREFEFGFYPFPHEWWFGGGGGGGTILTCNAHLTLDSYVSYAQA